MQRFRAASITAAMTSLLSAFIQLQIAESFQLPTDEIEERNIAQQAINDAAPSIAEIPLSNVLRSQFERLAKSVEVGPTKELAVLIREFHNNLIVELSSQWFLMIPNSAREMYEQRTPPFGEDVARVFPEATHDIGAACRCLALDEWTASVFHLMRVLEHGLRKLATNVGLPPEAMRHENWKNVIDQIESKIRAMESLPKSDEKIIRITKLSSMAVQFRYFKDAWRNHVSHANATYDPHTAEPVWRHVKAFMMDAAKE